MLKKLENRKQEVEIEVKDNENLVLTSDYKHKIKGEKINEKFGVKARDFLDPLGPFPSIVKNEIKSEGQQHITETSDRFLNKNSTSDRFIKPNYALLSSRQNIFHIKNHLSQVLMVRR